MNELLLRVLRPVFPLLPRKFFKHYVKPLTLKREQVPYDAKKFFESYHVATLGIEFSDRATIFPTFSPLFARFHYNATENSIIEYFAAAGAPQEPAVLDIGSGAGHWIDFYQSVFGATSVVGIEISQPCVEALQGKYRGSTAVRIMEGDVASPDFSLAEKFDIISAIGVMFHVVDDALWLQALKTLAGHLRDDGVLIVGGQFGMITQNVQFHNRDDFSTWEEYRNAKSPVALVDKRIRSLSLWKASAREAGLRVLSVVRTRQHSKIRTPENNVLVLGLRKD